MPRAAFLRWQQTLRLPRSFSGHRIHGCAALSKLEHPWGRRGGIWENKPPKRETNPFRHQIAQSFLMSRHFPEMKTERTDKPHTGNTARAGGSRDLLHHLRMAFCIVPKEPGLKKHTPGQRQGEQTWFGEGEVGRAGLGSAQVSLGKGSLGSHPHATGPQPPAPLHGCRCLLSLARWGQRGQPALETFAGSITVLVPAPFRFARCLCQVWCCKRAGAGCPKPASPTASLLANHSSLTPCSKGKGKETIAQGDGNC